MTHITAFKGYEIYYHSDSGIDYLILSDLVVMLLKVQTTDIDNFRKISSLYIDLIIKGKQSE